MTVLRLICITCHVQQIEKTQTKKEQKSAYWFPPKGTRPLSREEADAGRQRLPISEDTYLGGSWTLVLAGYASS